jgi:tetratricopeptide (TPR) repeat protein
MLIINRGLSYHELADYASAITDYTKSINLNQSYVDAYHNRGLAYAIQADYISATTDAKKACSLGDCELIGLLKQKGLTRE